MVERYPVDGVVERADGDLEATFPVASERWLERLLLRLGTAAEVSTPAAWRTRAPTPPAGCCSATRPEAG